MGIKKELTETTSCGWSRSTDLTTDSFLIRESRFEKFIINEYLISAIFDAVWQTPR